MASIRGAERQGALPRRARSANQGKFGRVLVVGSGSGMPGAVRLAGEACLRLGAGLTTVAVAPENVAPIAAGRPELICGALGGEAGLGGAHGRWDVIARRPGLRRCAGGGPGVWADPRPRPPVAGRPGELPP